jgi:hypothetical protein
MPRRRKVDVRIEGAGLFEVECGAPQAPVEPGSSRRRLRPSGTSCAIRRSSSDPIASLPDEKKKGCDHPDQDQHPVLAFETEKRKTLNEKLHRPRSPFLRAE